MAVNTTKPFQAPFSDLINNDQAAAYLGVTPRTLEVWRCTKRYKIPFIKVGRLVRYRQSSLDAFLSSRTICEV